MRAPSLSTLTTFILFGIVSTSVSGEPPKAEYIPITSSNAPPQQKIPSTKRQLIHGSMRLGALVEILGPPWAYTGESVGFTTWFFDDGSVLTIKPNTYKADEIMTFK